jgi:hypothetical protein
VPTSVRNWFVKLLSAAVLAVAAVTFFAAAAVAAPSCTLYASPSGSDSAAGTLASPLQTPQKLVDSLQAGQTGCLRAGTYNQTELTFSHAGRAGAPVTLMSYPGETATLSGGFIYVPQGSDYVTIANLHIDSSATAQVGVQLMAANDSLTGDDITNGQAHDSCIILGSNVGWGQAVNTTIANNVIHQCGNTADGNQDHGIYADNSVNATIDNNVIWGAAAYAIHLYQNSQGSQITHNVIVGNGYGVIFAGSGQHNSSGNVVADNIIANSTAGYDVSSYWGGTVGTGNTLKGNCLAGGHLGQITTVRTGFAASGNVSATPGFVNAAAHNYRLSTGSPCLSVVGYDTAARIAGGSAVATVSSTHRKHSTRTRIARKVVKTKRTRA